MTAIPSPSPTPQLRAEDWLDQIFATRAALTHGVIYRPVRDVEREIGSENLELEVRRRGFHLLRTGRHYIIVCDDKPLQVIC